MKMPTLLLYCVLHFACASRLRAAGMDELKKLAEQGDSAAQAALGVKYLWGKEVPINDARAFEWLLKAALQRNADAQYVLGTAYASGIGVSKDDAKAADWYNRGAVNGNVDAQYSLATMYADGSGISKDEIRAYAWFNLSAARNYRDSAVQRDALAKRMTKDDQTKAQNISAELFAKMPKK